jgi:hypothetical protein
MEKTRPGLNYDKLHFNRKTVAGALLDTEYDEVRQPMNEQLSKAKELVLLTDAGESDRHEKLYSISVVHNGQAYLYQSGVLKETSHTSDELLKHLLNLPVTIKDKTRFILADGDSTAQAACSKFAEEAEKAGRPPVLWAVCRPHTLNRMTNDVMGTRRSKGKEVACPFHPLHKQVTAIASAIKNTESLWNAYSENVKKTTGKDATRIPFQGGTRWTTAAAIWDHLHANRAALVLMRESEDINKQLPGLESFLSEVTWKRFCRVREILDIIVNGVNLLQSDWARIGLVIPVFRKVLDVSKSVVQKMDEADRELGKTVIESLQRRLDKVMKQPWMVTATCLSPFLLSKPKDPKDPKDSQDRLKRLKEKLLDGFAITADLRKTVAAFLKTQDKGALAAGEMLSYLGRTHTYDAEDEEDLWETARVDTADAWWKTFRGLNPSSPLATYGVRFGQVPAGTAAQERVFSLMGWQSEKRRNRLLAEKIHKLTTVHMYHCHSRETHSWWKGLDEPEEVSAVASVPEVIRVD